MSGMQEIGAKVVLGIHLWAVRLIKLEMDFSLLRTWSGQISHIGYLVWPMGMGAWIPASKTVHAVPMSTCLCWRGVYTGVVTWLMFASCRLGVIPLTSNFLLPSYVSNDDYPESKVSICSYAHFHIFSPWAYNVYVGLCCPFMSRLTSCNLENSHYSICRGAIRFGSLSPFMVEAWQKYQR
jgi:hypothetical protein